MLDLVGTVFTTTAIAVILISVASTLPLRLGQRIGLAVITGGWLGVATATAAAGAFADPARGAIAVLALFALPLAATATLALLFPAVRQVLLALPAPLLVGLNVVRVGGVLFLLLAGAGRLAGPFPYLAGWGDIITGALALPVAWVAARKPGDRRLIAAWNAFGALDLIVAVALGITSRNGSPVQLIHAGVGTLAMTQLPWSTVPTFLVPYFLISHGVVFAQLGTRARRVAGELSQTRTREMSATQVHPKGL